MNYPQSKIADIAESQIGTEEDAAHTNRGAAILKYQACTTLGGQGWPWCAAFVDWCVDESGLMRDEDRPKTPAAFDLIHWGANHGCLILSPSRVIPQRGDIVVYTFSHCGIVADVEPGYVHAVEGNTNSQGGRDGYEVAKRLRAFSQIKALIRIPLIAQMV